VYKTARRFCSTVWETITTIALGTEGDKCPERIISVSATVDLSRCSIISLLHFMYKYAGHCLRKGNRVIKVLFHIAPSTDQKKSPSGGRHWKYACEVNWKTRFILTHNISRYVCRYGYIIEDEECWLHAHHALKNQENVKAKEFGLWNKFLNLFR